MDISSWGRPLLDSQTGSIPDVMMSTAIIASSSVVQKPSRSPLLTSKSGAVRESAVSEMTGITSARS